MNAAEHPKLSEGGRKSNRTILQPKPEMTRAPAFRRSACQGQAHPRACKGAGSDYVLRTG